MPRRHTVTVFAPTEVSGNGCADFICRGVRNLRIVDRNVQGFEGPWLSFARLRTLRSPKHLTGPAQGPPNLTCRAWFETQGGAQAWRDLERIPRAMWLDYLRWCRAVLSLPVENQICVRHLFVQDAGQYWQALQASMMRNCAARSSTGCRGGRH